MPKFLRRFSQFVEEMRWEDATSPKWWVNFLRRQARLYFYIARETVRDRCLQQAAALTFTTLLSLVPLFAVAFSLFRGFEAFKGIERKAERAIFRTVLAAPLVEGLPPRTGEEEEGDESEGETGALPPAELSAQDLLKQADALPRMSGADEALSLYLEALQKGADAKQVRSGLGTLHFGSVGLLRRDIAALDSKAVSSYAAAAGVPTRREEKKGMWRERMRSFAQAITLQDRQDFEGALEELSRAESIGYPLWGTRIRKAQIFLVIADQFSAEHDYASAYDYYRRASENLADAFLLAAAVMPDDESSDAADDHNRAVRRQGECQLELGRREMALYHKLEGEAPEAAKASLQKAIGFYQKASLLQEDSAETERELADTLWAVGQTDEARKHYVTAIERRRAAVARGFSTAIVDYIHIFSEKISSAGLGVVGILFLIITATSLFNTIEKTLNHIWQVTEKRAFWIKFTSFCTLIWLGPALIGASMLIGEKLSLQLGATVGEVPVIGTIFAIIVTAGRFVLPFVTVWLVLMALYKFLPHAHVQFKAASWGAFVATIFIQIARPGFRFYITGAIKYEKIYGSLGAVPIFLLWIWLLWVIVLFGAEVSFTVQNVGLLSFQDKLRRRLHLFIDRYLAARIMMYVARDFWRTGKPVHLGKLAETLQISPEEAADATRKLVKLGFLTPVGEELDEYHPARDLSKLKVMDVLNVADRFRGDSRSVHDEDSPYEEKLEDVFNLAIDAQRRALKDLSFRDLLESCEAETGGQGSDEEGGPAEQEES